MTGSQGTLVQSWRRWWLLLIMGLMMTIHIVTITLSIDQCPELLVSRAYNGVHCQPQAGDNMYGLVPSIGNGCGSSEAKLQHLAGEGICLTRDAGDVVRLKDIRMSFKFPADKESQEFLSSWNWRVVGSLSVNIKIRDQDLIFHESMNYTSLLQMKLSSSLDYAPMSLLNNNQNSSADCVPSSPWHSKAIILNVNRSFECKRLPGMFDMMTNSPVDLEHSYHCSIHPLFELLSLSNSSFIVQVRLQSDDLSFIDSLATISSHLTLIKETDTFHRLIFYTKCFFTPLVLLSLVWFIVRLCINDLYVSIPDRLLITVGLAQTLVNIPTEVAMAGISSTTLSLLDPIAYLVYVTSFSIFWMVFTKDKLATNEPWERTTRFYWKTLLSLLLTSLVGLLCLLYLKIPIIFNPFNSHWLDGTPTILSLSFIFSLVLIVASYQTYFSVLIFRVVCDISIRYSGTRRGCQRLKVILIYCLVCSVLMCLGVVTRLAISLILHWNSEVHMDPLPFAASSAGMLYLAELSSLNLHVCFLLIALSRSSGGWEGGVGWYLAPALPVMYNPGNRDEQLHLWDLAAMPSQSLPSPYHK